MAKLNPPNVQKMVTSSLSFLNLLYNNCLIVDGEKWLSLSYHFFLQK
jgi:hypothetical protein